MKKYIKILVVCLLIIFTYSFNSYASIKLVYDGKTHIYNERAVTLFINEKKIAPSVPPVILFGTTLVPARAVFEELGAKVTWNSSTNTVVVKNSLHKIILKINNQTVSFDGKDEKITVPAKIINGSTMIPLRFVSEKLGLEVKWDPVNYNINLNTEKEGTSKENNGSQISNLEINNITYTTNADSTVIKVSSNTSIKDYKKFELNSENSFKLVVDIPDAAINLSQYTLQVNDGRVLKIRSAQYQLTPKVSRVVLDMASKLNYDVSFSADKKTLVITVGNNKKTDDQSGNQSSENSKTSSGTSQEADATTGEKDDFDSFNSKLGDDNAVLIEDKEDKVCVSIQINKAQEFNVSRKTDPESIEIDLDNAKFVDEEFSIPLSSETITSLKCEKNDSRSGRITISTSGQLPFEVYKEPKKIEIYIYKEGYSNLSYKNAGALSTLVLSNVDITKQVNIQQYEKDKKIYVIIPKGMVQLNSGSMYINDKMFEWIKINNTDDEDGNVILKINSESKITYSIRDDSKDKVYVYFFARDKLNAPDGDLLIAIDAGHGGEKPGAVYKDASGVVRMVEADINLDMARRVNKLLEEAGIPTIMTREKDVDVDLLQRTAVANNMKADLFISIHINSVADPDKNPSASGTETLYFPYDEGDSGLTSKRFAEIVQDELINTIDTTNRKIVPRPGLAVLNSSEMPSALVELAFISNESDRQKLSIDTFRDNAAQAIFRAILKAANELE